MRGLLILLATSAGCGDPLPGDGAARVEAAVLAMVGRHPEDAAGLEAAFEESDFFDTALDAALGRLIEQGRVEVTDRGLRAVPRDKWPVDPLGESGGEDHGE